jgi:DNA-binding GntR family transcriptional regulator
VSRPAALVEIEPLERQTLGERAYAQLCELLVSGRMAPGEKVSLRGAAGALGVSMMPVREAVSRLVADRALEVTPNRSIRVPVMSVAQFRELAAVRIAIEGHAAAEAARVRSDDDLVQIVAAESAFRRQSTLPNPDAGLSVGLNKDFHFAIYVASASPLLVEIIRGLWLKAGPVLNLDLRASPERLREGGAVRFHADALEAIKRRDCGAARAAIAADITGAADFIIGRGALEP